MVAANLRQDSDTMERVELMLRNGETEKAMAALEQNFGPHVKRAMENVMKYSTLKPDELVRACGKIADFLDNVAEKIEKHERFKAIKEKIKDAKEDAAEKAEREAIMAEALERQLRFEARMEYIENLKRKLAEQKKQLEEEHRRERNMHKRRKLEEKMRRLEERRKQLDNERQKLETMRKENETREYSPENRDVWQTNPTTAAAKEKTEQNTGERKQVEKNTVRQMSLIKGKQAEK